MTTLAYPDAYLARHCTDEREARALEAVDELGTFAAGWRDRLAVLLMDSQELSSCKASSPSIR